MTTLSRKQAVAKYVVVPAHRGARLLAGAAFIVAGLCIAAWFALSPTSSVYHHLFDRSDHKGYQKVPLHGLNADLTLSWLDQINNHASEVIELRLSQHSAASSRCPQRAKDSATLSCVFGAGYHTSLSPEVQATGFKIVSLSHTQFSPDQDQIVWAWNARAKQAGVEYAVVALDATGKPASQGPEVERQIWVSDPIKITVEEPLIERDPIVLGNLFGSLGLSSAAIAALSGAATSVLKALATKLGFPPPK